MLRHHQGQRPPALRCWEQFPAILFCQLRQAPSLREAWERLPASKGKRVHLGFAQAPPTFHPDLRESAPGLRDRSGSRPALPSHLRAKLPRPPPRRGPRRTRACRQHRQRESAVIDRGRPQRQQGPAG
ncbi:MAG: DUF4372 domain-containing protein, partial [Acidobacteriota bacterium]